MHSYSTLSEAIQGLKGRGYTEDFQLKPHCVECAARSLQLHPEDFSVDEIHRFEGMSNPDDNSILLAISSTDGIKGLVVDAYGVYSENLSPAMIDKLRIKR